VGHKALNKGQGLNATFIPWKGKLRPVDLPYLPCPARASTVRWLQSPEQARAAHADQGTLVLVTLPDT